ncbi:GNAT family N-acetyltransferase [Deinococcus radiophilus]|uniref:GNAT family N-acetyltransferase n=1 Tax=Deinococcus radiophilus TaxID=32062 RepID=A0A431W1M9_9DEIO|nr:GNAT family N-acetyltransferase [Deinococcus radiophilus]RTR29400.1 GNAT family N-acetyltransferase [Deinococcus radiophilus]UFA50772.1 GNAT family N-acetyltransferase [Deinococcus radiophilus]
MTLTVRRAVAADAPALAHLRGVMQLDNGRTPEQIAPDLPIWEAYYCQAVPDGRYLGWLAVGADGAVIGGAGVQLYPAHPSAGSPHTVQPHILNVAVEPPHRRQGVAGGLVEAILAWARAEGYRQITLNAAPMGAGLYRRLGFRDRPNPGMLLEL